MGSEKLPKTIRPIVQGFISRSFASLLLMFHWSSPKSKCKRTRKNTNTKKNGSLRATRVNRVSHSSNQHLTYFWLSKCLVPNCHFRIILSIIRQNKLVFTNFHFIFQKSYLSNLFYIVYYDILVPTLCGFHLSEIFLVILLPI